MYKIIDSYCKVNEFNIGIQLIIKTLSFLNENKKRSFFSKINKDFLFAKEKKKYISNIKLYYDEKNILRIYFLPYFAIYNFEDLNKKRYSITCKKFFNIIKKLDKSIEYKLEEYMFQYLI